MDKTFRHDLFSLPFDWRKERKKSHGLPARVIGGNYGGYHGDTMGTGGNRLEDVFPVDPPKGEHRYLQEVCYGNKFVHPDRVTVNGF